MIKLTKTTAKNTETNVKESVHYVINGRVDKREAVTIYAKKTINKLNKVFSNTSNNSDMREDYYENGKVVIFKGDALYEEALKVASK